MQGDLHIHTRLSDGSLLPHEVLRLAKRSNLDCIAITNHDSITPINEIKPLADALGISLIDGVEISARDNKRNRRVHILCYMPKDYKLIDEICSKTIEKRMQVGLQMTEKVSKLYPITVDDVKEIANLSKCIYKQHITHALMNASFTTQIFGDLYKELFDLKTGSCIINCQSPDIYEVIDIVKKSAGICVMAHPFTYDSIDLLDELISKNLLDGIEVWSSKSNSEQEKYLLEKANKNNLIATGGSDFHGAYSSRIAPLGAKPTPAHSIKALYDLKQKLHS